MTERSTITINVHPKARADLKLIALHSGETMLYAFDRMCRQEKARLGIVSPMRVKK